MLCVLQVAHHQTVFGTEEDSTSAASIAAAAAAAASHVLPPPRPPFLSPGTSSLPLSLSLSVLPPPLTSDMNSIELPHSCSNENEEFSEPTPIACPHQWLCDGTLLCLLDARHSENITAFQKRWRRGEVCVCVCENVLYVCVYHKLESFSHSVML